MFNATLLFLALLPTAPDPDIRIKKEVDELITQLGHRDYRLREAAGKRLLEIGPLASEAIKAGMKSADSEISDRCQKLYPLIWRQSLDKKLAKFIAAKNEAETEDLPLSKLWLKTVGDSKNSRELYADVVRLHSEPLAAAEKNPDRILEIIGDFVKTAVPRPMAGIQPIAPAVRVNTALPQATVATYLFLGTIGEPRRRLLVGTSSTNIYEFFNSDAMQKGLDAKNTNREFPTLFARWLEKEHYSTTLRRAIDLAATNRVTEANGSLLKIASDKQTTAYIRAQALIGFGRIASKDQLKELEPFLKDDFQMAMIRINNTQSTVQMRDIALGVALMITGQAQKDYGFDRDPPAGIMISTYTYFSFSSDEKRTAAHDRWKEWIKNNIDKK